MANLEKLKNLVKENGDALLLLSPVNRLYASGFKSSDGYVICVGDKIYNILDFRYFESAKIKQNEGEINKNVGIVLQDKAPFEIVKDLIGNCQNLLVEQDYVSFSMYKKLENVFDGITLLNGSEIMNECRMQKTNEELDKIKKAQSITDLTYSHILSFISENLSKKDFSEKDIALEIEYFMKKNGADDVAFDTICVSGTKSSLPHGTPSYAPLQKGFLTMDFGAKFDGYCSDMTRTICIGKPSIEMKKVYDTVLEAQNAGFEKINANIIGSVPDKAARDYIDSAGYKGAFGHSLGHSLGLEIHESPNFSPKCDKEIPENAVLSVEPGIYLEGKFGVRIEDIVRVTKDSFENLTQSSKELIVI